MEVEPVRVIVTVPGLNFGTEKNWRERIRPDSPGQPKPKQSGVGYLHLSGLLALSLK